MSIEENKELIRRRLQIWNEDNLDLADEIFATDVVAHEPAGRERIGIDAFKQLPLRFRKAMPDLKMKYEGLIVAEHSFAYRWTLSGTHEHPLGPFEPLGTKVHLSGMIMGRVENGEIKEEWVQADFLDFYRQLGFVDFPIILEEL